MCKKVIPALLLIAATIVLPVQAIADGDDKKIFKELAKREKTKQNANNDISLKALVAGHLRLYVINRETVDERTEKSRLESLKDYSSEREYNTIIKINEFWKKRGKGFKREIAIQGESIITKNIHRVEFDIYDKDDSGKIETEKEWVAIIEYEFSDKKVSFEEKLKNPIRLTVTFYRVERREQ